MNDRNRLASTYKAVLAKPRSMTIEHSATGKTGKTVISKDQLHRMQKTALNKDSLTEEEEKKRQAEERERVRERAQAMKAQMRAMDAEQLRRKQELLGEDCEQQRSKNELQSRIESLQQAQIDEIKYMSLLENDTRCVFVREQQLTEKREALKQNIEEVKRLDLIMEVGRLKKVRDEEEKERRRRELEKEGRRVIIDQIQDNHLKRLKQMDEQAIEAQEMVAHAQRLKEEELQRELERKARKAETLAEIVRTNHEAMHHKRVLLAQEKEEDDKIMHYLKQKALKEEELQREQQRLHDLKEKEIALLREKQEKAMDRQMELDQLRAKRARQKEERLAREREQAQAELAVQRNLELKKSRQEQIAEKHQKIFEQALRDKQEYDRIIVAKKDAIERERALQAEKENQKQNYKQDLLGQIGNNREKWSKAELEKIEEGKRIREKVEREKAIIRANHAEKTEALLQEGVQPKFVSKFKGKKFI